MTTTKPEQLFQTAGRNEEIIFDASTQLWSSEKKFHFSSRRLRKKIKASGDNDLSLEPFWNKCIEIKTRPHCFSQPLFLLISKEGKTSAVPLDFQ